MTIKTAHLLDMKYLLGGICIMLASIASFGQKGLTGSWGDQGDGTYKNPVLNADYPDIDIEQLGDTYYMISSKQHMSPGMVILESKDLVNWDIIGHVWDSLSWAPEYRWDRMDGYAFGVWAGDLAYHEGTWYCYQIDYKHGLYVSTAKDIRGPWTQPHKMLPQEKVLDDPAVYWDDENHEAFLICNTGKKQMGSSNEDSGNENRVYKMSWDGTEIVDTGKVVYSGPGAEAAKIYKIDGILYIFMAEWFITDPSIPRGYPGDANDRKQIVLRSTSGSMYGPFEKRIVLERGNDFTRSCSQGALTQAPDDTWWYMHQLIQNVEEPFQGRPQCLEPVSWVDGWPIIGVDVDEDGIGEPVWQHRKPIDGYPITAPATDDDFAGAVLGKQWEWNHNPRSAHWSLKDRPGWLRLKASVPVSMEVANGPQNNMWSSNSSADFPFWRANNTLSQRIMGVNSGVATAKFDVKDMEPGQRAGFVRYGGVYHLLGVHMDEQGKRRIFFTNKEGSVEKGPVVTGQVLFVKTINNGNQARFEYSFDDNSYIQFGPTFTIAFGNWTGDRLGFFCWNELGDRGSIDVDYFEYDYDGPNGDAK